MPLVLVCREKNLRRSDALAELTRNTRWPRRMKNTAIGSHAGPVGSTITSRRTSSSQPAKAACSTSVRLWRVGWALRFATWCRSTEGVPPFRFHDLRHTHVAWLVAGGAPLPHIQARLGHESITTTIDTYGHLLPAGDELISGIIDTALTGGTIRPARVGI